MTLRPYRMSLPQPSEVGGEQRALLQSVLSRRSPGIYIQTYFTTRNEVESFIETGCRKHYSNRLYNDRNPLSVGGNFFERSRLQRSGPDSAFMHDIIIPRDASQQAYVGERIEIAPDFSNVQRGDLVFFGRKATADRKEGISHVGIYLGNKRFIHALGDVHVSSFDPEDEYYDEFNTGRLLFATRFLPYINKEKGMNTTDHNPYYLYD